MTEHQTSELAQRRAQLAQSLPALSEKRANQKLSDYHRERRHALATE